MPPLVLNEEEVQQLQALAHSRSLQHSIVQRAQIVLACGAGESNTAIAKRMGLITADGDLAALAIANQVPVHRTCSSRASSARLITCTPSARG
ncbi:MAG: hypothetical protein R6W06_14800 [Prochlorococcaceae cyanobacterium]